MPGKRKSLGRDAQHSLRHSRDRIERPIVGDRALGNIRQRVDLLLPGGLIAD
jgi:hypothetical protein